MTLSNWVQRKQYPIKGFISNIANKTYGAISSLNHCFFNVGFSKISGKKTRFMYYKLVFHHSRSLAFFRTFLITLRFFDKFETKMEFRTYDPQPVKMDFDKKLHFKQTTIFPNGQSKHLLLSKRSTKLYTVRWEDFKQNCKSHQWDLCRIKVHASRVQNILCTKS